MDKTPRQIVTIHQQSIAYATQGSGQPIVFLHGWGANIDLVWQLAQGIAPKGYQVWALDLPSFGDSPEPPSAWTVFDYAQLVIAFMDYHKLDKVNLFGHSFGGRLSLILGAEHPELIHKMALADTAGIRPQIPVTTQIRTNLYKSIRDGLNTIGLKSLSDELRQKYNARYGSADFNSVSGVMRQTFINVINQDLLDYAKRVQAPTLLFWGDQDTDTPLWMGQTLEKEMPDAGLVVYEGAGHYSYLERLTQTIQTMDYFFKN
jgi:pimeloyl-ACP methyl ester carboxylesterase